MMRQLLTVSFVLFASFASAHSGAIKAGAAAVDITPLEFPVIVNGGFLEKTAAQANDKLFARSLVLADGQSTIAVCVVDTCMMPRELIDEAKALASKECGIAIERMLVSATHTHSAPAAMACLGTRLDPAYARFLRQKVAESITAAAKKLALAEVGWTTTPAWKFTNCRRWIRRPDKMLTDPFGVVSARANMHPGYTNPDAIGPSGPIDPELSMLSVRRTDGRPLCLLANFSMHYFGAKPVSADYFGAFVAEVSQQVAPKDPEFVAIMSQGTSGDSHWMDYSRPKTELTIDDYTKGLAAIAVDASRKIEHRTETTLAMAESTLRLRRRVADAERLQWAKTIDAEVGDRAPKNQVEVYAMEQLHLAAEPVRELKLQALRIGEFGITAIPNEVYAITGLKLKLQSPLRPTMNIELANGAEGYIPPPEQHRLGGYTTWAARTAGLEVGAEPAIVEQVLSLLEKVSGSKRRTIEDEHGHYARGVLEERPLAYWRLNEIEPPLAADATGRGNAARYHWERGVAFFLPGVGSGDGASSQPILGDHGFSSGDQLNRAPHFAGGALQADLRDLGKTYTVSTWVWNGLDPSARAVTGTIFSRQDESLGIMGAGEMAGRLFVRSADSGTESFGKTQLGLKKWHHIAIVRSEQTMLVYLDGNLEITAKLPAPPTDQTLWIGGNPGRGDTFEGRIDEVAVFDRTVGADELPRLLNRAAFSSPR